MIYKLIPISWSIIFYMLSGLSLIVLFTIVIRILFHRYKLYVMEEYRKAIFKFTKEIKKEHRYLRYNLITESKEYKNLEYSISREIYGQIYFKELEKRFLSDPKYFAKALTFIYRRIKISPDLALELNDSDSFIATEFFIKHIDKYPWVWPYKHYILSILKLRNKYISEWNIEMTTLHFQDSHFRIRIICDFVKWLFRDC